MAYPYPKRVSNTENPFSTRFFIALAILFPSSSLNLSDPINHFIDILRL